MIPPNKFSLFDSVRVKGTDSITIITGINFNTIKYLLKGEPIGSREEYIDYTIKQGRFFTSDDLEFVSSYNKRHYADWEPEVQEKILEKHQDINTDYDWWKSTYEDAKNSGLEITAFGLHRYKHAEGNFITSAKDCAESIIKQHGEGTETWKIAIKFLDDLVKYENFLKTCSNEEYDEDIEDFERQFLRDLLNGYCNILQREVEYLESKDAILETIDANQYFFNNKGEIV